LSYRIAKESSEKIFHALLTREFWTFSEICKKLLTKSILAVYIKVSHEGQGL
jgi:hypothetical protein